MMVVFTRMALLSVVLLLYCTLLFFEDDGDPRLLILIMAISHRKMKTKWSQRRRHPGMLRYFFDSCDCLYYI